MKPGFSSSYVALREYNGKKNELGRKQINKLVVCCFMHTPMSFGKKTLFFKVLQTLQALYCKFCYTYLLQG